ncbi:trafficking protein particle complex subunit 12-like isoform X2 [Corticium candelabrum]|uniref:trafficking protein particle complex subunit 12-like isoform X2 n=1 Tax=Corticium candelabrum TaxID=121492 RepID=UPI002E25D9ED|nr:trafficking protein particle complex subunit 12-like isoform X2 [Corticium candelabrum]
MGQSGSRELAEAFERATSQLSDLQLSEITSRFNEIYSQDGCRAGHLLNRENFSNHFQLPVVLGDRLFTAFDVNKSGTVSFEEFVCGLAVCLHGTVIDKAALLFKAFNLNEDEGVSQQEMATMLYGSLKSAKTIMQCTAEGQSALLQGQNEQEIVQKIVADAFKNCDITRTGKLLPIEFEYWLKRNPQFMDNIFGAIFPSTNQSACQSSLTMPDSVREAVPLDMDEQLLVKKVDVTTSLLRSEPSLEDIVDDCNREDGITEDDGIVNETVKDSISKDSKTSPSPKPSPVLSRSLSLKSSLEIVDDHYADHSSCKTEQVVVFTHEMVEQMELVVEPNEKDRMEEVFSGVIENIDSPLSSLAHKVCSFTSKISKQDEIKTAESTTSSLFSPTTSLTSVPPTPDLEPERMHIAWLPSEHTRQLLNARKTGVILDHQVLTLPGLSIEGPLPDPVTELLKRYGLDQDVRKPMMTADSVVPDPRGFRTLVTNGCFRSALDLAGKFLSANGQGLGSRGQPGALHTHKTLQVWMCRIALLVKLHLYSVAQTELDSFGDFDRPDLYFDFHADIYPEHQGGSLVPFSLRLLYAELPQYLGSYNESLDKLYKLLHVSQMIESNLASGLAEDGSRIQMSHEEQRESLKLWKARSVQVMYAIGNCLVGLKDYHLAVSVFESLLEMDPDHKLDLLNGIGRVHLQLGNIAAACSTFREVEATCGQENEAMVKMNLGMVQVALAKYKEGQQFFQEVLLLQPENAVAVNNLAACLVYQGRVKEAVTVLEELVWRNPAKSLQESVLFNLCTAYELDSSQSFEKKKSMLSLAASHRGDNFNTDCLKIGL